MENMKNTQVKDIVLFRVFPCHFTQQFQELCERMPPPNLCLSLSLFPTGALMTADSVSSSDRAYTHSTQAHTHSCAVYLAERQTLFWQRTALSWEGWRSDYLSSNLGWEGEWGTVRQSFPLHNCCLVVSFEFKINGTFSVFFVEKLQHVNGTGW